MQSTYKVSTDKQQKIKVDSSICYALWLCGSARAGSQASLEVRTTFVGEGASIEITGYTSKDKKIGKISDTVTRNRFTGALDIPEKIDPDTQIYFEAKLPKHSLKMESNLIPVKPKAIFKKMGWDKKEVRRGDEVKISVEFDSGVANEDEAFIIIYEYSPDNNHEKVVSIPTQITNKKIDLTWKYECQDDTAQIPTQQELDPYKKNYKHPEYFFVVLLDEQRIGTKQESGLLRFKDTIELQVNDSYGQPLKDQAVEIYLPDGTTKEVKTDADGKLSDKDLPPGPIHIHIKQ